MWGCLDGPKRKIAVRSINLTQLRICWGNKCCYPLNSADPVDLVLRFELCLAAPHVLSSCSQLAERDDLVLKVFLSFSSELEQEVE